MICTSKVRSKQHYNGNHGNFIDVFHGNFQDVFDLYHASGSHPNESIEVFFKHLICDHLYTIILYML